jgi:hypothetical protein
MKNKLVKEVSGNNNNNNKKHEDALNMAGIKGLIHNINATYISPINTTAQFFSNFHQI